MNEAAIARLAALRSDFSASIDEVIALLNQAPPAAVTTVRTGDNLRSMLEDAPPNAIFSIEPDYVQEGNYTFHRPIELRSAVPIQQSRVDLNLPGPLFIGSFTATAPVTYCGLRFQGAFPESTLIPTGPATLIDRCLLLGNVRGQHRGVRADSEDVRILRSHIDEILKDQDTQAVGCFTGTKRLMIDDCYLGASGENFIAGGADSLSEELVPEDIVISNSTIEKRLDWRVMVIPTFKNLLELKNCRRVRIWGNRMLNSWVDGQAGYAIVLTVRNQSGREPWSNITDVVIEDNTVEHMAGGIQILATDDEPGHPSGRMRDVIIRRNTFRDIDRYAWGTSTRPGFGRCVQITGGPQNLTIEENEFYGQRINSFLSFDGRFVDGQLTQPCEGLRVVNNLAPEGNYGVFGANVPGPGVPTLNVYCPDGYEWSGNRLMRSGPKNITYPAGTEILTA